jgi:hypothetical protein
MGARHDPYLTVRLIHNCLHLHTQQPPTNRNMGFHWNIVVNVQYGVEVKLSECPVWYMYNYLQEYQRILELLTLQVKSASLARLILSYRPALDDEFDEEYDNFDFDEEFDMNVAHNDDTSLTVAFEETAAAVLGRPHYLKMTLHEGGAHGEADEGVKQRALFILLKEWSIEPKGYMDVGRGSVNVPFGVTSSLIPSDAQRDKKRAIEEDMGTMPAKRRASSSSSSSSVAEPLLPCSSSCFGKFEQARHDISLLLDALGLEVEDGDVVGFHLITVADGG